MLGANQLGLFSQCEQIFEFSIRLCQYSSGSIGFPTASRHLNDFRVNISIEFPSRAAKENSVTPSGGGGGGGGGGN